MSWTRAAVGDLLRRETITCTRMESVLDDGEPILLCPVVLFETERGLQAKPEATSKRAQFSRLLPFLEYRELTEAVWREAASMWAEVRKAGRPHMDADLLIGAFAKVHAAKIVTRNTKDFVGLGVPLEDWAAG